MISDYQKWSAGFTAKDKLHGETDAVTRLTSGDMLDLCIEPKFRLPQDAKYYCIGSCFARHVEDALMAAGKQVLSAQLTLPDFIDRTTVYPPSVLTKFNTFSMGQMVDLAAPGSEENTDFLVSLKPGEFWNPHLHNLGSYSLDRAKAIHAKVCENVRMIVQADCVILTLGLTEYWLDQETGTPLNTTPIDWKHARKTGRFVFRNSGFSANMDQVRRLIAQIRARSKPDCRIILTVSPVPLQRTFEQRDIIVANSWSKSVLRAVCGELVAEDPGVDYFPSYEIVTNSPPQIVWHHDRRHVQEDFVARVMATFLKAYLVN